MAEYQIECEQCGGPYLARRSDAKQCASCRLLRILTYVAARTKARKCRACGDKYSPARREDRVCGHCDTGTPKAIVATCSICKRDAPMYERCTVCVSCVKGVDSQPIVIRALQKGKAHRRKLHPNRDKAQAEV